MTASAAAPQGAAAFPCSLLLPVIYSFGRFILSGTFSELFLLHDLHFCDSLLYYTPFAPSTGRGAENQVQQNLKNLQIKI